SLANYEAGIALRLLTEVASQSGDNETAKARVEEAIARLESATGPLLNTGNYRLAAMAFQALGTPHEWQAYLLGLEGDPAAPLSIQKALINYQDCAEVGEQHPFDTYMVEQIVQELCLPRIQALNQTTGG